MLTIHHLGVSQSDRIVWLCEELGLPYALVRHERDPATRAAPDSYKALHPAGTAPIVEIDGRMLAESGAIVDYLIHRHANGRLAVPPGADNYFDYVYWLHFANGSLMPAVMLDMIAQSGAMAAIPALAARPNRLDRAYAMIEARLGETPFLAGEAFTAADLLTIFPLTTMRLFAPRDIAGYPNIRAYLARIAERPAFARAMARADPDLVVPLT